MKLDGKFEPRTDRPSRAAGNVWLAQSKSLDELGLILLNENANPRAAGVMERKRRCFGPFVQAITKLDWHSDGNPAGTASVGVFLHTPKVNSRFAGFVAIGDECAHATSSR